MPKGGGKTVNKLYELLELRSQNDMDLPVKDFEKRHSNRNRKSTV